MNDYFVHESSYVDENTSIGKGTKIWHFSHIMSDSKIGENCNIGQNVVISPDVIIGNNVTVKSGVQLWNGVRIGDNVFIGPNVTFTNEHFSRSKQYPDRFEQTLVKEFASLGANCTVIAGNVIGEYSLVGSGCVVTKDIPPHTVWYGNPIRQHGYITKSGILLDLNYLDKNGIKHNLDE